MTQLYARIAALEAELAAERSRREQAEQAAQRNIDTLLLGPFIIFRWVAAEGWPVEYVSENVATLFGYSAADFMTGTVAFANTVHPEDLPRVGQEVQSYSAAGVPTFEQEYRIVHRDGTIHWIYDFTAVIRDTSGSITHYYGYVLDITARKQVEDERLALQEQIIRSQQANLQELSTPLIPVSDNAVAMPLIGTIDSRRAQQVLEMLLAGIAEHHADVAILDITGVQMVDTQVARALVQAAQAARLLGTRVVLTGIRPEVAQTLVQLGADLHDMHTLDSLKSGIAYALASRTAANSRSG